MQGILKSHVNFSFFFQPDLKYRIYGSNVYSTQIDINSKAYFYILKL